jgi:hypothetical protein
MPDAFNGGAGALRGLADVHKSPFSVGNSAQHYQQSQ